MNDTQNHNWIILFLRIVVAILFVSAGFTFLTGIHFFTKSPELIKPWFPLGLSMLEYFWSASLLLLGICLCIGYRTALACVASIFLLLSIHFNWIIQNPFHNTLNHLVPYLLLVILIYILAAHYNKFSVDHFLKRKSFNINYSIISLAFRLFVAIIFFMQGLQSLQKGPLAFAEKLYVTQFENTVLPSALLWFLGIINPFIQIVGGALLIVGLFTRSAAIVLCFFMTSIIAGHMFMDPYETSGGLTKFGLNNFLFILGILFFIPKGNRYSIDFLLRKK